MNYGKALRILALVVIVSTILWDPLTEIQTDSCSTTATSSTTISWTELETLQNRLLGPSESAGSSSSSSSSFCKINGCGCPRTPTDCPQQYSLHDLHISATAFLDTHAQIHIAHSLEIRHVQALQACRENLTTTNGGYCLSHRPPTAKTLTLSDGRTWSIPQGHADVSQTVAQAMVDMMKAEGVTSLSDFGAGVGQYGRYFKEQLPELMYRGYDGAGDIEAYTQGFVSYTDLTLPLEYPISEWVMSLEVGEHIPSQFEGVFVRNLHRHNCKGMVLSWAILGQGGENHINNHSNEYIRNILTKLNYTLDEDFTKKLRNKNGKNLPWLVKSIMAFRRNRPVC